MTNEIDLSEFNKFMDDLINKYPITALNSASIAMEATTDYLIGIIPDYPQETTEQLLPPDGVSFLHTEQQRKWFFAAVRADDLRGWKWEDGHPKKVGGARRGNLQRALTSDVKQSENEVIGEVGFDKQLAPYAPWVVGDPYPGSSSMPDYNGQSMYQARVHVDRWWIFNQQINEHKDKAFEIFKDDFWATFSNAINLPQK